MSGDQDLVAYCGLYCGECLMRKAEIANAARDLRDKLDHTKFARLAEAISPVFKELKDYPQCRAVLEVMENMRCDNGCRQGGGDPNCKVRSCCKEKKFAGCWECAEFETCSNLEFLRYVHGENNLENMRKIRKSGMKAFLEGPKYW